MDNDQISTNTSHIDELPDIFGSEKTDTSAQAEKLKNLNFICANARSLGPKINSLIDYFDELDLAFAIISETWFKQGNGLENLTTDLKYGHGLKLINKTRPTRPNGQTISGGGVAIIVKNSLAHLKPYNLKKTNYEVVAAAGKLPRTSRRLIVFSVYLPPSMKTRSQRAALKYLADS